MIFSGYALHPSAKNGHEDIVISLIKAGAPLNIKQPLDSKYFLYYCENLVQLSF